MCTYAAKVFKKHKQPVKTAIFNASYLCLVGCSYRSANILPRIIRRNNIKFHEIIRIYGAKNVEKLDFLK